jgi:diaminopimelate epimerase
VLEGNNLAMRVYERGCGETQACGTGAAAAVIAALLNGIIPDYKRVNVKLLGGELTILADINSLFVMQEGPAQLVFSALVTLPESIFAVEYKNIM